MKYFATYPFFDGEPDAKQSIFDALANGGSDPMELQATRWAEKHGSCTDRYGVRWMITFTGDVPFEPDS